MQSSLPVVRGNNVATRISTAAPAAGNFVRYNAFSSYAAKMVRFLSDYWRRDVVMDGLCGG